MFFRVLVSFLATIAGFISFSGASDLPPRHLSLLGAEPDWTQLDALQNRLSASEFKELLEELYLSRDAGLEMFRFDEEAAWVRTRRNAPNFYYRIGFREDEYSEQSEIESWRAAGWRGNVERPLEGLVIALDPGHIGGEWSALEQRHFRPEGESFVVKEAEINLIVVERAKALLEAHGVEVILTRAENRPMTDLRPDDLFPVARTEIERTQARANESSVRSLANLLFYRVAELQARAEDLKGRGVHLALSIHFNALPDFGGNQRLSDEPEHLHFLVNGSYLPSEVALDNVRFEMLERLLKRYDLREIALAESFAEEFSKRTELPAFRYTGPNARAVGKSGYVWARNLLANRIFPCPVIYLEPYAMNGRRTYYRLAAGDFEGTQSIQGREEESIYREYAEMIEASLLSYFSGLLKEE
ncbi:MAG: N-acetylmuramoyl-L-alanine amidase [Opitutales bacterium]|nr:N-acetylmuramoyl-L-alanine amidase [Opitutales bacterium]